MANDLNVVEYIKQKIIEQVPDADIRPSSALHDLMISPLGAILGDFKDEHDLLINMLSLIDPENISEDQLDYLASNFFLERNTGSKVSGNVRVYFDTPVSISIPAGTKFTTSAGLNFYSIAEYSISRIDMLSNIEGGLYFAGDIPVEAEEAGTEYAIKANEIVTVDTLIIRPVRVRNIFAFVGGADKESNSQLVERIKDTYFNNSLLSTSGIKKALKAQYTGIQDIQIIGAGSSEMIRDLVATEATIKSNYFGKIYGVSLPPRNRNIAYNGRFTYWDTVSNSGVLPSYTSFAFEVSQEDYYALYSNGDNLYAELAEIPVFQQETFNGTNYAVSGLGAAVYNNAGWIQSDGKLGQQRIRDSLEFEVEPTSQSIKLGYTWDSFQIYPDGGGLDGLSLDEIAELSRVINALLNNEYVGEGSLRALSEALARIQDPVNRFNYSPIFHRAINPHNNIEITGKFYTNDPSTDGEMSYITVLRNINATSAPHDGYGIAWRKGDGSSYNVYIVDNNTLQDEIYIGKDMLVQDWGVNNFIRAAKLEININTWYRYKIQITRNYDLKAWIWEDGDTPTVSPTIEKGSLGDGYAPSANGSHFGVSVGETKNGEWRYGDLNIQIIGENYPMHLFKIYLDPALYGNNDTIDIKYYGYGEGDEGSEYGVSLYAYNEINTDWELLGTHYNDSAGDILIYSVSGITPSLYPVQNYRNGSYYMHIIAVPQTINSDVHKLYSDFIEVLNSSNFGHSGNHADIYISAPDKISTSTIAKTISNSQIILNNSSIELLGPIQEIVSITLDSSGITLGDEEWEATYVDEGEAFSYGAKIKIQINSDYDGALVNILYKYYTDGPSVQNYVTSDSFRSPGQNNLVKLIPPYVVVIEYLEYTGNVSTATVKAAIKSYINSLTTKKISKSDIVSVVLDAGATSVDITDMVMKIRYQNIRGRQSIITVSNNFNITGTGAFYTDDLDLSGVVLSS